MEAQTEQFGRDRPELPISVTPFLLSTKTEEEKMKEKNETDFHMEDKLLATQICKGMLNTLTKEDIKQRINKALLNQLL